VATLRSGPTHDSQAKQNARDGRASQTVRFLRLAPSEKSGFRCQAGSTFVVVRADTILKPVE